MKEIEIDLSQPFEKVLEAVLALPNHNVNGAGNDWAGENELTEAIRGLYEATHGRQVETEIGLIAIAPPIAPFLKARPFRATTLKEFLVAVAAQIASLPLHRNGRKPTSPTANRDRKQGSNGRFPIVNPRVRAPSDSQGLRAEGPKLLTPQTTAVHHD